MNEAPRSPLGPDDGGRPGSRPWVWSALALAFAAVLAALFVALFPGAHSVDTLVQVNEGLSGHYLTAHPPLLSWMLGTSVRLVGSPWPVLALQMACFAAAYAGVAAATRSPAAATLMLLVFCLPPTWGVVVTLWKDVWLATGLCVIAAGLLVRRPGLRIALFFVGALGACLFRHNAPVVVGPVAAIGIFATVGVDRVKRGALVVVLAVLLVGLPRVLNVAFDARPIWGLGPTAAWDICHFYKEDRRAWAGTPWKNIKRAQWKKACLDNGAKRIINQRRGLDGFRWRSQLTKSRPVVEQEWLRLVRRDPVRWLGIRARDMRRFLAADGEPVADVFAGPWKGDGLFTPTDVSTKLYGAVDAARVWFADTPLQRPVTWALALVALVAVAIRRRDVPTLAVACGLGLHLASLYFVLPAAGFRYAHVVVVGVAVMAGALLARRGRAALSAPAPAGSSTAAASG